MTWFDRKICTVKEAQRKAGGEVPGFLQIGDRAKLWIPESDHYHPLECWVVGMKVGFQSKFFYDVAVPLGDSGFCAVIEGIYGYVTPPHLQTFDPERYEPVDITDHLPQLRRDSLQVVRSISEHAAQAGVVLLDHNEGEIGSTDFDSPPPPGPHLRVVN
jgi:hypothetical protein